MGNEGVLVDHFDPAQHRSAVRPSFGRVEFQHLSVYAHQLRKALRQYAEEARFELARAAIEHHNPGTARNCRNILADRSFKSHDRQFTAIPVDVAEHPVLATRFLIRLAETHDFGNTGARNDQSVVRERDEQAV